MSLVKRLQEATSLADVAPILNDKRFHPTFKKVLETAMILKNHADPAQRELGESFMRTALQEADKMPASQEPAIPHDYGVHPNKKKDGVIREEELDNNNPETGNKGSTGSSENEEPFTAPGEDEPNTQIEGVDSATGIEIGGDGVIEAIPGLDPNVAREIGSKMSALPNMTTGQVLRQVRYTVTQAVEPLRKYMAQQNLYIRRQNEAIKQLSNQVREIEAGKAAMKIDVQSLKRNSFAREIPPVHETVMTTPKGPVPLVHSKAMQLEEARYDIAQLDKQLRSKSPGIE